ncbi:glutathione S-transferase N-terminal domain-containing protein [Microbaculum sp. FT89]|uniref:glutathione S-transferase N-terminal domain-containing protein n=1 Tax=Microbaculum sp. FT89 TaxID=3447298 RepID=UPI003F53195D
MRFFTCGRSTTSYGVRIALDLKGIAYEAVPVNVVAGEQGADDYPALNPGRSVPTLVLDVGTVLTQSMAILDWLEETQPETALLPDGAIAWASVRAAALVSATDVQPVNNLRVISRLGTMGHEHAQNDRRKGNTQFPKRGGEAAHAQCAARSDGHGHNEGGRQ